MPLSRACPFTPCSILDTEHELGTAYPPLGLTRPCAFCLVSVSLKSNLSKGDEISSPSPLILSLAMTACVWSTVLHT